MCESVLQRNSAQQYSEAVSLWLVFFRVLLSDLGVHFFIFLHFTQDVMFLPPPEDTTVQLLVSKQQQQQHYSGRQRSVKLALGALGCVQRIYRFRVSIKNDVPARYSAERKKGRGD